MNHCCDGKCGGMEDMHVWLMYLYIQTALVAVCFYLDVTHVCTRACGCFAVH